MKQSLFFFKFLIYSLFICFSPIINFAQVNLGGFDVFNNNAQNWGANPLAATSVISNLTINNLSKNNFTNSGTSAQNAWGGTGFNFSNSASATRYAEFSVQVSNGYELSLDDLIINYRRSGTGPNLGRLDYSINGGSSFTTLSTNVSFGSSSSSGSSVTVDLSTVSILQSVSNSQIVVFRLYPYNASESGGTWYFFDRLTGVDVYLTGTVLLNNTITTDLVTFNSSNKIPNAVDNYTADNIILGSGIIEGGCDADSWFTSESYVTSANTSALANTEGNYYEFKTYPTMGYDATYASIIVNGLRVSTTGPINTQWAYRIGSGNWVYSSNSAQAGTGNCSSTGNDLTWDFTDFTTDEVVTFRLLPYGSTDIGGTHRAGNITLKGVVNTASSPPSPTVLASFAAGNTTGSSLSNSSLSTLVHGNGLSSTSSCSGSWHQSTSFSLISTPELANTNNDYYEFTITPSAGYQANVSGFKLTGLRRSSTGPTDISIAYKFGSGAWNYEDYDFNTGSGNCASTGTEASWDFGTLSSAQPITFRILPYGATNTGGTFRMGAIQVFGSMSSTTISNTENENIFKVMSYNALNYGSSQTANNRDSVFKRVIENVNPDIMVFQEIVHTAGYNNFKSSVVDTLFGVGGPYNMVPFVDCPGNCIDNASAYKRDKFDFVRQYTISTALRNIDGFRFRHKATQVEFIVFSVHLKAGDGQTERNDRRAEIDSLMKYLDTISSTPYYMITGDFNTYSNSEPHYMKLTTDSTAFSHPAVFVDPFNLTGTWQDNTNYKLYHSQSSRTSNPTGFGGGATGGLDDRFDFYLYSKSIDNIYNLMNYVPNSFEVIGQDGNRMNLAVNDANNLNTSVSTAVANALYYASDHLPVVAEFQVSSTPLPVTLSYFEAGLLPNFQSILNWQSSSEINFWGYEIERLASNDEWETIGFVKSKALHNTGETYQFIDNNIPENVNAIHYRLKMIDNDASFEYSKVKTIRLKENKVAKINIYPNPFTHQINIEVENLGNPSIHIFNSAGKKIKEEQLSNAPKGVYYIRISHSEGLSTHKIIKQ